MSGYKEWQIGEWLESKPDCYDLEAEYDSEVAPLVEALVAKCRELDMPTVVVCAQQYNETGPATCMNCYLGESVERCSGVVAATVEAALGNFEKAEQLYQLAIQRHQASE